MKWLAVLTMLLVASFAMYLWRGLPEISRLETARREMHARRELLLEAQRNIDLVTYSEHARLVARRDELTTSIAQRLQVLADDSLAPPPATLAEALSSTGFEVGRLADELARLAAASPEADQALGQLIGRLAPWPGLVLEELTLEGASDVAGVPGLAELRAELVVMGATPDLVACLESLVPERGAGLPAPTVLSASLRRIPPDRWGGGLDRLSGPPARLSAHLAFLFASPGGERP